MEIKINKEIRDYQESIFMGLSLRQFLFSLLACVAALVLFFLLKPFLRTETISWICILAAFPFAAFGFVRYHGMYLEELIRCYLFLQLFPRELYPVSENLYAKILADKPKYREVLYLD